MEFIGFMLLISLIGIFVGVVGVAVTSSLSIWSKIAIISFLVFIYAVIALIGTDDKKHDN